MAQEDLVKEQRAEQEERSQAMSFSLLLLCTMPCMALFVGPLFLWISHSPCGLDGGMENEAREFEPLAQGSTIKQTKSNLTPISALLGGKNLLWVFQIKISGGKIFNASISLLSLVPTLSA